MSPSLALIEFTGTPAGVFAMDRLIKKAPIASVRSGTVSPGRFLVLFNGTTASVEESYREGLSSGEGKVWDSVFLPRVHPSLDRAVFGERHPAGGEALLVLESASVCSVVQAVDISLKGTDVVLLELRLADEFLHGRGLAFLEGTLQQVQMASDMIHEFYAGRTGDQSVFELTMIPTPHEGVQRQLTKSSRFFQAETLDLKGEEL